MQKQLYDTEVLRAVKLLWRFGPKSIAQIAQAFAITVERAAAVISVAEEYGHVSMLDNLYQIQPLGKLIFEPT